LSPLSFDPSLKPKLRAGLWIGKIQPRIGRGVTDMASREKTVAEIWAIYAAFVITFFLFIFMIQMVKPPEKPVSPAVIAAFAFAAISYVPIGATVRKKFLDGASESLHKNPADTKGLRLWRTGNIFSFCIAESTMLFGVALKFLGARWMVSGIFFVFGLVLIVLWIPKIEMYPSTNAPAPPSAP
jgi:hypothetical protein